jgi:hypothetical protein
MVMAIPLVIMAVGAAVSAAGAIKQGNDQAAIADYNAKVGEVNAQQAQAEAAVNAGQQDRQTRQTLGQAAAAYGAAGVDMTGSPLDVMMDSASQGELAKRLILYQGDTKAAALRQGASVSEAQGGAAQTAGYFSAGSTLLTSAGSIAYKAGQGAPGSTAGTSPLTVPATQTGAFGRLAGPV